jgi:hypothetical protein
VREPLLRGTGLVTAVVYAVLIVSIYARQPETLAQLTGGVADSVGAYRVDAAAFAEALTLFHEDRFIEARASFARADPAERDARTQFYIAYSYYREGWRRFYNDDGLFTAGLTAADKALALAPNGRLVVDDPRLKMHSIDALRAELEAGLRTDASDFNPVRVFRERK